MMNCENKEYDDILWMYQMQRLLCPHAFTTVFHFHGTKSQIKIQSEQN